MGRKPPLWTDRSRPIAAVQHWQISIPRGQCSRHLQFPSPSLADEVFSEAVYLFFFDQMETCFLIELSGIDKHTGCPEDHVLVAREPRKPNTLFQQPIADSHAPGARVNVEHPQLGGRLVMFDDKDRTDNCALFFRDPASLAGRVELTKVVGDDFRHQRFELHIPTVFAGIELRLLLNNDTHIARL